MSSKLSATPVERYPVAWREFVETKWARGLAWGAIFVLAVVLRVHQLHEVSAWYDEAASWKTIQFSWPVMLQSIRQNVHPLLYYVVAKLWAGVFGYSPDSLRAFSVLCGVVTVGLIGLLVREAVTTDADSDSAAPREPWFPLLASALYAINPMAIEQAQQARMYTLGILFAALLGLGTLRVWKSPLKWSGWVLVILFGNLLPLTHYYGFFTSLVAAVAIGVRMAALWREPTAEVRNAAWARFGTAIAVTLPVWLFWGPVFWAQHSRVQAAYWIQRFTWSEPINFTAEWVSSPWVHQWGSFFVKQLFVVCIVGAVFIAKSPARCRWVIAGFAFAPPLLSTLYSLASRNLLQGRYWSFAHLFFIVGLVVAVQGLSHPLVRRGLATVLVVWSLLWVVEARKHRNLIAEQWGLRGAGETLRMVRFPGEPVLVASSYYHPSIQWYQGSPDQIYVPALGPYYGKSFPGEAILRKHEVLPLANTLKSHSRRLWIMVDRFHNPHFDKPGVFPLPPEWQLVKTFKYFEGNRLPSSLELREYHRQLPPVGAKAD
jgi:mannosyltransferase